MEAYEALQRDPSVRNAKEAMLIGYEGSRATMMRALKRARELRAERAAVAGAELDS